jgi:hypothetical protein
MQPDDQSKIPDGLYEALLASGFPFQTAIEEIARRDSTVVVEATEWPWRDETADCFLDLVISRMFLHLVIECKKTSKDKWVFLRPRSTDETVQSRCAYMSRIPEIPTEFQVFCADTAIGPGSPQSEFCVAMTSASGGDRRLLEKDAQKLVRGTNAFARNYALDRQNRSYETSGFHDVFLPVIVTNAELFVADYDPKSIDLETGQFVTRDAAAIRRASFVRFRKCFTSGHDLEPRTVLVVTAPAFPKILRTFELLKRGRPTIVGTSVPLD